VPAKQSVVIYGDWDSRWAVNPVSKTAWFDSDHDAPITNMLENIACAIE
jgi:hypothetical protein